MDVTEEFLVAQLPHWVTDPEAAWTPFAEQGHAKDDIASAYSMLAGRCDQDNPALSLECRLAEAHLRKGKGALVRLCRSAKMAVYHTDDGEDTGLNFSSQDLVTSILRIDTLAARACAFGVVSAVANVTDLEDEYFDRLDNACTQLIAEATSSSGEEEIDPQVLSILGDTIYSSDADDGTSLALHAMVLTVGENHEYSEMAWAHSIAWLDRHLDDNSPHRPLIPVFESCYERGQFPMAPRALGGLYPDEEFVAGMESTQAHTSDADVMRLLDEALKSGPDPLSGTTAGEGINDGRGGSNSTVAIRPDLSAVLASLDRLVGLGSVKQRIRDLIAIEQVNHQRVEHGMRAIEHSLHLVFTGPPGTGKTTVARLVAQAYAAIGVLESGIFKEAGRVDLVGAYLGQTAIKTQEMIDSATGGILFIDEAYSLTDDDRDAYGSEAIATLLKAMEDRRDEFAVIAAGYTEEMSRFIESNPGLRSRFATTIEFPPYSDDELLEILRRLATEHQIKVTKTVEAKVLQAFANDRDLVRDGNGRYVRNLFEVMTKNMAVRAMADGVAEPHEFSKFTTSDVPSSMSD